MNQTTLKDLIIEKMVSCVYEMEKHRLCVEDMFSPPMFSICNHSRTAKANMELLEERYAGCINEFNTPVYLLLKQFSNLYLLLGSVNIDTIAKCFFDLCIEYIRVVGDKSYLLNRYHYHISADTDTLQKTKTHSRAQYPTVRRIMNKHKSIDEIENALVTKDEIEYTFDYLGLKFS